MKKSLFVALVICVLFMMSAISVQAAGKTGWVRKGTTYKYKVNNIYVKNEVIKIKKYYYYFDKKGIRKTEWVKYKKDRYYFDKKKGYAYTGRKKINNKLYIFDKKGRLVKKKGLYKYGKTQVYINTDGSLATGIVRIKNKAYFFEENGVLTTKNGIHHWKNRTYYIKNGQLLSGWVKVGKYRKHFNKTNYTMDTGVVKIDNKYYHFDEEGVPESGICTIQGAKYYCDRNGERKTGFITIGSNQYYFAHDGKMVTSSYIKESGNTYYADASGRIKKNCWYNDQYFDNRGCVVSDAVTYDSSTQGEVTEEMLNELPLSGCTKLMVVAHPDDETLWGGAHLTEGGWFVVCLTNGYNQVRRNEFNEVMKKFGCTGLILSYRDLISAGQRSNWETERYGIAKDIDTLLKYKHWGMVATHNPNGEYGHMHHKMTSTLVTQCFYKNYWGSSLYYFGKWYSAKKISDETDSLKEVPNAALETKLNALKIYSSQKGAVDTNIQMAPYENWVRATEW